MKETDVAAPVVADLRERGWRVYQEVELGVRGRADIVATWQGKLVWIIEAKTRLSWDVLGQAERWFRSAHYVSVAVPKPKRGWRAHGVSVGGRSIEQRIVAMLALGLFEGAAETIHPVLRRVDRKELASVWESLHPLQESMAEAGTNRGGYYTPFRGTIEAIVEFLRQHPGSTTKEVVAACDHHYKTDKAAAGNLVKFAGSYVFAKHGISIVNPGGKFLWSYDEKLKQQPRCGWVDDYHGFIGKVRCGRASEIFCKCGEWICTMHEAKHRRTHA